MNIKELLRNNIIKYYDIALLLSTLVRVLNYSAYLSIKLFIVFKVKSG